ncbi:MAG: type II toxin-antitoxin system RelE family toxin [Allosphingosinicella sp.]
MMEAGPRRVRYSRDAVRTLKRIDQGTARRIRSKIGQLAAEPDALANNVRALSGGDGQMRLRVGRWRVIYTADTAELMVLKVAPRGSAYE